MIIWIKVKNVQTENTVVVKLDLFNHTLIKKLNRSWNRVVFFTLGQVAAVYISNVLLQIKTRTIIWSALTCDTDSWLKLFIHVAFISTQKCPVQRNIMKISFHYIPLNSKMDAISLWNIIIISFNYNYFYSRLVLK